MNGVMDYENSGVVDEATNFFKVVGEVEDEAYIFGKLIPRLFEYIKNREVLPLPVRLLDLATALLRTPRPKRSSDFIDTLIERVRFNDESKFHQTTVFYPSRRPPKPGNLTRKLARIIFPTVHALIDK